VFPQLASRHIYPPEHLHIFTEHSAQHMLTKAGLDAAAVWTFGQDYYDLISCAEASAGSPGDRLYGLLAGISTQMQAVIDASGLADTLFVIARKAAKDPVQRTPSSL
jgi:hypothetical protein